MSTSYEGSISPYGVSQPAPRHSGLGVASFVMAMVGGVGLFVLVVLAGVMAASNPGGKVDDKAPVVVMLGLGIIGGVLFAVVGAGLGIAGIVQKNRKKLFATLGLIFNALAVLGVVGLMIIGLAAK